MRLLFLKQQYDKATENELNASSYFKSLERQKTLRKESSIKKKFANFSLFSKKCFTSRQLVRQHNSTIRMIRRLLTDKHYSFLKQKTGRYLRVLLKHKVPFGQMKIKTKLTTRELWVALGYKPLQRSKGERFLKLSRGCLSSTPIIAEVEKFFTGHFDKNAKHLLQLKRKRFIRFLARKGCDQDTIKQAFLDRGTSVKPHELD
jgi:hypothetical protein